jgi:CRISPR-associated protein Csx10
MMNGIVRVKLLSDLCSASGDGFAGVVDTDVCFLENGLPFIPGKRLKGCLRECGLDILSVDNSYEDAHNKLFGETGKLIPGELTIGNGMLEDYANITTCIPSDIHRSEIMNVYTSTRARTKIEDGTAAAGSLRTARVLNKGLTFDFPITLNEDLLVYFEMCVKSLRSTGLNRSRGLGEISCTILEDSKIIKHSDKKSSDSFEIYNYSNEAAFSYKLTLIEPVISAERSGKPFVSEDYIFGSAMLGVFATRYIKKHNINPNDAYKDNEFRRIFLEGAIKFTSALPYVNNEIFYPAPATLKKDKLKKYSSDVSNGTICGEINRRLDDYVSFNKDGIVKIMTPGKVVFMHHARPSDKSVAHADSEDGGLYSYEALSEGQQFVGSIVGNKDDLESLINLISVSDTLKIGRSRTAQYGNIKISAHNINTPPGELKLTTGDVIRLVAITPVILEDNNGTNSLDLNIIAKTIGQDFEVIKSFCTETVAAGYYGKWLLPKAHSRALAEGSVVLLKYDGNGTELTDGFIGLRNAEGFGQVRFERLQKAEKLPIEEVTKVVEDIGDRAEPAAKSSLVDGIHRLRAEKEAVTRGMEYGESYKNPPKNAVMQRVVTTARASTGFDDLAQKLCKIKQAKQLRAALMFACSMSEMHFMTDAEHLKAPHISELLKKHSKSDDYNVFCKYIIAAATRIKQKQRDKKSGKGGENDEH